MWVGCLGAARITPVALVAPARARGDVRLAAVAARDPARAAAFAREYGFDRAETTYQALIDAPDIDLIYNALAASDHARWTIRALDVGKHVLCEKPLAMNLAEAEAMAAAAERSGRRLIEAFHYRYHPLFAHFLHWLWEERIGRITGFEARFDAPIPNRDGREIRHFPQTGGGAFMDLGCYPLAWSLAVFDREPDQVEATATLTPTGVDESLDARLLYGDVEARIGASMAAGVKRGAWLVVSGERGAIRFHNPLAPQNGSKLTLTVGDTIETAPEDRSTTYAHQLDAVLTALRTGAPLPTEGPPMLRQQRVLDAIYRAAGLGSLRGRQESWSP